MLMLSPDRTERIHVRRPSPSIGTFGSRGLCHSMPICQ
ncbi:hypothetical protein GRAN_4626 [Granulicella sibirica]|uniref:Uncharacterized protein n=1 Tax=Granulicella sibirica TaxID=2479048 RepID=A0A4Q0SWL4_9BACT|nr:hypothetical protein GRAN_4626 [Granulicella sibirica]